jgi:hypothetical protein
MNVKLPNEIAGRYGFTILPTWKVSAIIPEISDSSVLVFGGYQQLVYVFDISPDEDGIINLVKDDGD